MSDYVNPFVDITLASLQDDIDFDAIDWPAVRDGIESGPWRGIFDWGDTNQGADAQPDDR
jgi:hypothetical protein